MELIGIWAIRLVMVSSAAMASTDFIKFCEMHTDTSAGYEGGILSPTGTQTTTRDCTIHLMGIPEYSWFELSAVTLDLPCRRPQCDYVDSAKCDANVSYIQIQGVERKLCNPSLQSSIIHYKNHTGPVTINLYSDSYNPWFSFNLTYRVASVIDVGLSTPKQEIDVRGQRAGYVVSHAAYGIRKYRVNITSHLTLKNLKSNVVMIKFIRLYLHYLKCYDRLVIKGAETTRICQNQNEDYENTWTNVTAQNNTISFVFKTSRKKNADGFMFQYIVWGNDSSEGQGLLTNNTTGYSSEVHTEPITNFVRVTPTQSTAEEPILTANWNINTASSKAETANMYQTIPPPGGSTMLVGVVVGISVLVAVAILVVILSIVWRRKRMGKRKVSEETQITPASGGQVIVDGEATDQVGQGCCEQSENQERHENPAGGLSSLCGETAPSQELNQTEENTYSIVSERSSIQDTGVISGDATYEAVEDIRCSPSSLENSADQFVVHQSESEIKENDAEGSHAEDKGDIYHLVEEPSTAPSEPETEDHIYAMVEQVDDYANIDTAKRLESESEIADTYSPITATTKTQKGLVQMLENELYGT